MMSFLTRNVVKFFRLMVQSSYNLLMVFYNARKIARNLGF